MEFITIYFILGCLGALAPEIIRLYRLRNLTQFQWSWYYLAISVAFAGLGGVLAWIMPATSLWGAFYIGAATPMIISGIFRDRKVPQEAVTNFSGNGLERELAISAEKSAAELLPDEEQYDEFYADAPVTVKMSETTHVFRETPLKTISRGSKAEKIWHDYSNAL